MNRLEAGKIINTHGLRGEVKVSTWTNYPERCVEETVPAQEEAQ